MKTILQFLIAILMFNCQANAMDYAITAETDANGNVTGYSDPGFDGITGNEKGFTVEQVEAAVSVTAPVSTSSGTTQVSIGESSEGHDAIDSLHEAYGHSHTPKEYRDARRKIVDDSMVDSIARLIIEDDRMAVSKKAAAFNDMLQRTRALRDQITAEYVDYGVNYVGRARDLTVQVDMMLENEYRQFKGLLSDTIALNPSNIHGNSEAIVKQLLKAYNLGPMKDPLSSLGLLGTTILVMKKLSNSFYGIGSDTIYLSKADVDRYGVAALYHELLHAGLEKGKKAGVISTGHYDYLGNLNKNTFSHLNGYVGNSRGQYYIGGYGYQEAFVIGWSYLKINSKGNQIKNSSNGWLQRAWNYRNDILANPVLKTLANGKQLKLINASNMSQADVKNNFLNRFTETNRQVRKVGSAVQKNTNKALPSLCVPGMVKMHNIGFCSSGSVIYEMDYKYYQQKCGDNYRWSSAAWTSCGQVIYNRTGDDR